MQPIHRPARGEPAACTFSAPPSLRPGRAAIGWPRCVRGECVPAGSVSVAGWVPPPSMAGCCPRHCPFIAHRLWEPSCLAAPTPLPLLGLHEETSGKCLKPSSEPLFPLPARVSPWGRPGAGCTAPTHARCCEPAPHPAVPRSVGEQAGRPAGPLGCWLRRLPRGCAAGCSRSSAHPLHPPGRDAASGTAGARAALAAHSCPLPVALPRSRGSGALLVEAVSRELPGGAAAGVRARLGAWHPEPAPAPL